MLCRNEPSARWLIIGREAPMSPPHPQLPVRGPALHPSGVERGCDFHKDAGSVNGRGERAGECSGWPVYTIL
jgi:hypothetical protein